MKEEKCPHCNIATDELDLNDVGFIRPEIFYSKTSSVNSFSERRGSTQQIYTGKILNSTQLTNVNISVGESDNQMMTYFNAGPDGNGFEKDNKNYIFVHEIITNIAIWEIRDIPAFNNVNIFENEVVKGGIVGSVIRYEQTVDGKLIANENLTAFDLETFDDAYYNIERQIRDFVLNMNADNITMTALRDHFDDKKVYRKATEVKGFSSATKYSAASFGAGKGYLLGAPEFILRHDFAQFREVIDEHSSLGERVLLFAEYQYTPNTSDDIFQGGSLDGVVIPVALVTLINRIRPEAKETFEYFASQGVTIKVISGDNPLTAAKAAEQAGIVGSDKYIDATLLNSKDKIAKAVEEYTVFGRVTPEQKRQFVRALKSAGHTVAMTGDGVNDVLALKDADCSIAMASGSDAAASVSDLVLLDSNFACMPSVVAEGRRVINNIQRSASLYLVKNVFSFILTLITIIAVVPYPLNPAQISLVSYFFIGIPSFFLALEPNHEIVKGKFLRNVLFKAFPAALSAVIVVSWSMLFAYAFNPILSTAEASTIAIFLYSFVAYLMLFRICRPMTLIHKLLVGSMGVLFLIGSFYLPHMFGLSHLDLGTTLVLAVLMLLAYPIDNAIQRVFNNSGQFKQKAKDFLLRDMEKHKDES